MGSDQTDSGSDSDHHETPNRSRSVSNASNHSGSRNSRSRSGSAASSKKSRSNSGGSKKSSRSGSVRSKSGSRSRSGSAASSESRHSKRSHSGSRSPASKRSGSGSPVSKRSKSGSPSSKRSKSGSPASKISKSGSSASKRSKSGSPESKKIGKSRSSSRESNESSVVDKRKRKILSDSDSNDAPKQVAKRTSKLIDTDSEEEVVLNPAASALFGDADDISTDDEGGQKSGSEKGSPRKESDSERSRRSVSRSASRDRSRSRSRGSSRDERDEKKQFEEKEKTPIPETRIDVEIPRIASDLGKDMHFVKLPNFLSVDTRPFDPETYEDEIDEEETLDEEGRQRLKLKVGNTIRWRKYINEKGETITDSNARFVRWSDGSLSLHLGSEIFDVYKQPLQNDHNHMFIRQGTGLQGQAVFRTKLTFRPHSTDSFTHKKMTMSLADRSQKTAGIKILTQVGHDPEAERAENLRKEEDSLRQLMRQRKPVKSKRTKRPSGAAGYGEHDNDEGSEDEGGISISAIKNKYKKGGAGLENKPIYSSDDNEDASDGSDFDARRKKKDKSKPTKALKDSDDSDNGSAKLSESEAEGSGKDSASDHSDDDDDDD